MNEFGFFKTTMPGSRPADFHLGCLDGCVFMDFNHSANNRISLDAISFDGYGYYGVGENAKPMNEKDSGAFITIMQAEELDQELLAGIVKRTIAENRSYIDDEPLNEYGLI